MKALANAGIVLGIMSMVIGIFLRAISKEVGMGLVPSSFLEFSVGCFLLSIAINLSGK